MGNSTSTNGTQVWDESHKVWVQNPANGTVWDPYTSRWVPVPSDPMSLPDWYDATYEEPLNCTNPTCLKEQKTDNEDLAIVMSSIFGPMALILAFVVISRVYCSLAGKWEARKNLKGLRRTEKMLGNGERQRAASEQSRPAVKSVESDASSSSTVGVAGAGGHGFRLWGKDPNRMGSGCSSSDNNSESTLPCSSELGSQNSESTMV